MNRRNFLKSFLALPALGLIVQIPDFTRELVYVVLNYGDMDAYYGAPPHHVVGQIVGWLFPSGISEDSLIKYNE